MPVGIITLRSWFSKNWYHVMTILFAGVLTYIGLKTKIFKQEVVSEVNATVVPRIVQLEQYKEVHNETHKNVMEALQRIERKIDKL